jgi:hypothetical protein
VLSLVRRSVSNVSDLLAAKHFLLRMGLPTGSGNLDDQDAWTLKQLHHGICAGPARYADGVLV